VIDLRLTVPRSRLLDSASRQLPFATATAINSTATDFQAAERAGIAARFTVRRAQFILRTVKIARGDFATKRKLEARVAIDPTRDVLAKFERGGQKRPRGQDPLSVPIEARRTRTGLVRRAETAARLGFPKGTRRLSRAGRARTFLVASVGIFRRRGPRHRGQRAPPTGRRKPSLFGDPGLQVLHIFRESVPIPPDLRFVLTARRTLHLRWAHNFARAWDHALRTAR